MYMYNEDVIIQSRLTLKYEKLKKPTRNMENKENKYIQVNGRERNTLCTFLQRH